MIAVSPLTFTCALYVECTYIHTHTHTTYMHDLNTCYKKEFTLIGCIICSACMSPRFCSKHKRKSKTDGFVMMEAKKSQSVV